MKLKKSLVALIVAGAIATPILTGCNTNNSNQNSSINNSSSAGPVDPDIPPVSEYSIATSGEAKVGERVALVLNKNNSPFTGDATFALKSTADAAFLEFVDASTVECKKEGSATVVAKVNNEVVAEKTLNIAKSSVLGLKEALDEAIKEIPFNGKAGAASAKTESTYTIAGKVVAIPLSKASSETQYDGTILIDDGQEIVPLVVYGKKENLAAHVGDAVQVNVKFTNYYGILEGIATASTADKQVSLYPDDLKVINRTFNVQKAKEFTATDFASYYAEAKANGLSGATKYTSILPIKVTNVKGAGGEGKDAMMTLEGDTSECAGKINITSTSTCTVDNTEGKYSNIEGYMVGGNSSSKYLKATVTNQYQSAPTNVNVTTADGNLVVGPGAKLQLIAEFLPAGAAEAAVKWYSLNETVATVEEDTGLVTGVSNGYACIQAKVEGLLFPVYTFIQVDSNPCTKVTLSEKNVELLDIEGAKVTLTAERVGRKADKPCGDELIWTSTNEAVATVEDGVVTKVGVGETTIVATCGKAKAECKVTVRTQTLKDLEDGIDGTKANVYGYYIGGYENGTVKGYWIADGDRGMYIYGSPLSNVQLGSLIHVTGAISNYNGGKQINPTKQEIVTTAPITVATPKPLVIDETNVGTLDAKTQGRLAQVAGKVSEAPTKHTYGTDNVTYKVEVADGKTMTVYLHKSYPSEANYNDAANKLKKGYTVVVEGYVSAYKSGAKDLSTVAASAYQLLNPKVISSKAPEITGIALDVTSAQVEQGSSLQLTPKFTPTDATTDDLTWTVEGNNKVTVDNAGKVKVAEDAVVGSTATVKVAYKTLSATCTITVKAKTAATTIDLTAENILGYSGSNIAYPSNSTPVTSTVGGIGIAAVGCGCYGNGIQMRTKNGITSTVYNTSETKVAKIIFVWNASQAVPAKDYNLYVEFSNSADFSTLVGTKQKVKVDGTTKLGEATSTSTAKYFRITHANQGAVYLDAIKIVLGN